MITNNKEIVFIIGNNLSGKSTLLSGFEKSINLFDRDNIIVLSIGKTLRDMARNGNQQIKDVINSGLFVDNKLFIFPMVKEKINSFCNNKSKKILFFDGFPRTVQQYNFITNLLSEYPSTKIRFIF